MRGSLASTKEEGDWLLFPHQVAGAVARGEDRCMRAPMPASRPARSASSGRGCGARSLLSWSVKRSDGRPPARPGVTRRPRLCVCARVCTVPRCSQGPAGRLCRRAAQAAWHGRRAVGRGWPIRCRRLWSCVLFGRGGAGGARGEQAGLGSPPQCACVTSAATALSSAERHAERELEPTRPSTPSTHLPRPPRRPLLERPLFWRCARRERLSAGCRARRAHSRRPPAGGCRLRPPGRPAGPDACRCRQGRRGRRCTMV